MSSLQGPVAYGKPHSELTDKERRQHEVKSNKRITGKLKELMVD